MTTDYERIKLHFESTAVCRHKQKPKLHWDGMPYIECDLGDQCKCLAHDGEGIKLTEFLAGWIGRFSK